MSEEGFKVSRLQSDARDQRIAAQEQFFHFLPIDVAGVEAERDPAAGGVLLTIVRTAAIVPKISMAEIGVGCPRLVSGTSTYRG